MADYSPDEVRDDYVPKADFLDRRFHELEKEHLWPKVWQIACRLEDIPEPGDYIVYEIVDESIAVAQVRSMGMVAEEGLEPPTRGL